MYKRTAFLIPTAVQWGFERKTLALQDTGRMYQEGHPDVKFNTGVSVSLSPLYTINTINVRQQSVVARVLNIRLWGISVRGEKYPTKVLFANPHRGNFM